MQTVNFQCGNCNNLMAVGAEYLGQQVRCPHCQAVVVAPAAPPRRPGPRDGPRPFSPSLERAGRHLRPAGADRRPVRPAGSAPRRTAAPPAEPALGAQRLPPVPRRRAAVRLDNGLHRAGAGASAPTGDRRPPVLDGFRPPPPPRRRTAATEPADETHEETIPPHDPQAPRRRRLVHRPGFHPADLLCRPGYGGRRRTLVPHSAGAAAAAEPAGNVAVLRPQRRRTQHPPQDRPKEAQPQPQHGHGDGHRSAAARTRSFGSGRNCESATWKSSR